MNGPSDQETKLGNLRVGALNQIDIIKELLSNLNLAYEIDVLSANEALEFASRRFVQESGYNSNKFDGQSGRTDAVLSDLKDQLDYVISLIAEDGRRIVPKLSADELEKSYNNLRLHIQRYRAALARAHEGQNFDIPPERPAPVKVRVYRENLLIVDRSNHTGNLTAESVNRIREAIVEILENSFDVLGHSHNADPRFIPSCRPFLKHLSKPLSEISVEALGFNWQIFGEILSQNKDALPISVYLQLDQASKSTNVFLSQFEEWRAYLSAQTIAELDDESLKDIVASTEEIIDDIFSASNVADEEIGDRLIELTAPVTAGLVGCQAIAVPLIDSLSNLFAQISATAVERTPWIAGTAEQIKDFSERSFKQGIVIFVLYMIAKYAPKFSNIPIFKFLTDAHALALKQFPWAKETVLK